MGDWNSHSKRNGDIELLRIVFATVIVLHHFSGSFGIDFAKNGAVTDEFLFIVTGMLMARSVRGEKEIKSPLIPKANWKFIARKIHVFYLYYIFSIIAQFVFMFVFDTIPLKIVFAKLFDTIPEIMLISMNGIYYENGVFVTGGWFLSAMLIAIFFLYPILRYDYEYASKYIFPCVGIMGIGMLFINYHTLNTVLTPMLNNIVLSGVVRAISEIALGVFAFELSQEIAKKKYTKALTILLTLFKWFVLGGGIVYSLSGYDNSRTAVVFFLFLCGCLLSFSSNTFVIPCNKFVSFLGELSVSLFFTHGVVLTVAGKVIGDRIDFPKLLISISMCFVLAVGMMFLDHRIKKSINLMKR